LIRPIKEAHEEFKKKKKILCMLKYKRISLEYYNKVTKKKLFNLFKK